MRYIKLALLLLLSQTIAAQNLFVTDLSCEHKINPSGIDVSQPRLSWKLKGNSRNLIQTAYSIRVSTDKNFNLPIIFFCRL